MLQQYEQEYFLVFNIITVLRFQLSLLMCINRLLTVISQSQLFFIPERYVNRRAMSSMITNPSNGTKGTSSDAFTAQFLTHSTDCGQSSPQKGQWRSSVESNSTRISPGGHPWQSLDFLHSITGCLEVPSVVILCHVKYSKACPWAANLLLTTRSTTVPAAGG